MKEVIHKLASIEIIALTVHLFCNIYLIKKVYFGSRVMTLDLNQEKISQKIYEPVILRKLKLSERFLRKVLCVRNSALGIYLLTLRTIIDVLLLKLNIGH